jgi:hypothetical protein
MGNEYLMVAMDFHCFSDRGASTGEVVREGAVQHNLLAISNPSAEISWKGKAILNWQSNCNYGALPTKTMIQMQQSM